MQTTTPQSIQFFSYMALPPVNKPKTAHYKDPSSAMIARLIEDTLNPSKCIKTASILVITSL